MFEGKLTVIAEQQGQDVNVFRALVKENEKINEAKKVSVTMGQLVDLLI